MAEDIAVDKQIDEGTVEAFERVCGVLCHDVTGQFSIFDGAWQVIQLAASETPAASDLSPAEQAQLRDVIAQTMPHVEAVRQIGSDIRAFLFPQTWADLESDSQSARERNRARWAPYDRAAWNTLFDGVRDHLDRAFVQLDHIEACIAALNDLKFERVLPTFDHFEPMLAANLRERLALVIETYTLAAAPEKPS